MIKRNDFPKRQSLHLRAALDIPGFILNPYILSAVSHALQ